MSPALGQPYQVRYSFRRCCRLPKEPTTHASDPAPLPQTTLLLHCLFQPLPESSNIATSAALDPPCQVWHNLRRRCRHPEEPATRITALVVTHAVVLDFHHESRWVDEEALASYMVRWCGVRPEQYESAVSWLITHRDWWG